VCVTLHTRLIRVVSLCFVCSDSVFFFVCVLFVHWHMRVRETQGVHVRAYACICVHTLALTCTHTPAPASMPFGVTSIGRLLKIIGLFCRISSL